MHWVTAAGAINLLDGLNYYFALTFLVGTVLRVRNYRAIPGLVYRSAGRWPKLMAVARTHRAIFVRWPTVLPVLLALLLTLGNALASHYIWSEARVTPADLSRHWAALAVVVGAGGVMGFLDFRSVFLFGRFDRARVEADLDRAEHWLGSWQGPAVRVLTGGLVNPRRIVGEQVREALVAASLDANGQLWSLSLQIAIRLAFGLALWVTWAVALR